ncbi:MAG: tetratricopeptide repeat protein [Bacteroidota bacterium]|nr:tetratricopeptide repeat protein [Candidatus Kapabacteria bacterium]MDW8218991.1 tetratricopeptide repeat protein [Bacteroidota bacterium]
MIIFAPLSYAQLSSLPRVYGTVRLYDAEQWFWKDVQQEVEHKIFALQREFPESPAYDRATLLLAEAQFRAGAQNPDEYIHAWRILDSFALTRPYSPLTPFAYELAARRYLERGRYYEARQHFARSAVSARQLLATTSDTLYRTLVAGGLYWQGVCFAQESFSYPKFADSAQAYLRFTVEYHPRGAYADDALFLLARYAELQQQYDTALAQYERIITEYPRGNLRLAAHIRVAQHHLQFRRSARALAELETAALVLNEIENEAKSNTKQRVYEPQSYAHHARESILYLRGEAHLSSQRFDAALQSFSTLLRNFPHSPLVIRARLGTGYALLHQADSSYDSRLDAALQQYTTVIEHDDFSHGEYSRLASIARLYRAITLKRQHKHDIARQELSALAVQSDFPFPAEALLELGELYYQENKYDEARRALERAVREATDLVTQLRVNFLLGETALHLRLYPLAVRSFEHAEQLVSQVPSYALPNRHQYRAEVILKCGVALFGAKDYRDAITQLTRFLNDYPYLPDSLDSEVRLQQRMEAAFWLAESYYHAELLHNAVRSYQALLHEYPSSPRTEEVLYGLGWAQFRLRQFGESAATFTRLLREYPQSRFALDILTRRGDGLYISKNYRAAAESYQQAALLQPHSELGEYAAFQAGQALYRLQDYERAIESMQAFARTYPNSPLADDALYGAAWIAFQQRRFADAAQEFRALLDIYPQGSSAPRAYYALGDSYFNLEQYDAAVQAYRAVIDIFPLHPLAPEAVSAMQYCYLLQGKEDSASLITDRYIRASPSSTFSQELKFKKAETLFNAGKFSTAAAEFEDFIGKNRHNPRTAEALYQLGRSYIALEDTARAFAAFRRIEKEYPSSSVAPRAALELALALREALLANKSKDGVSLARDARRFSSIPPQNFVSATTSPIQQRFAHVDSAFAHVEHLYPGDDAAIRAAFERAVLRELHGDTTGALQHYRYVADRYKGSDYGDRCRYRIAMFFRQHALYDSARAHLEEIVAARTDDLAAEAQYRIGELYQREKRYDEAIRAFLKNKSTFAGIEDWYTLALLNLGLCYEATKQFDAAKEMYRLIIAQRSSDDFSKTAQQRLERLMKL